MALARRHGWCAVLGWLSRGEWLNSGAAHAAVVLVALESFLVEGRPPPPRDGPWGGLLRASSQWPIPRTLPACLLHRIRRLHPCGEVAWHAPDLDKITGETGPTQAAVTAVSHGGSPRPPQPLAVAQSCRATALAGRLVPVAVRFRPSVGLGEGAMVAFRLAANPAGASAPGACAYVLPGDAPSVRECAPWAATPPERGGFADADAGAGLNVGFFYPGMDVLEESPWPGADLAMPFMSREGRGRFAIEFSGTGSYGVPAALVGDRLLRLRELVAAVGAMWTVRRAGGEFVVTRPLLFHEKGQVDVKHLHACAGIYLSLAFGMGIPWRDIRVERPMRQRLVEVVPDRDTAAWRTRGHRALVDGTAHPSPVLRSWMARAREDIGLLDEPVKLLLPPTNSASDPLDEVTLLQAAQAHLLGTAAPLACLPPYAVELARAALARLASHGINVHSLNKYNRADPPGGGR